ncbi:MAG: hypothetical protein ABIK37_05615 [candidate division WOR-3 bacterium]
MRRLLPAVLVLFAACEPTFDDYKPEPNVVSLLRTDRTDLLVMAGMSTGYDDSIADPLKWNGVSGVSITVSIDGNRYSPAEVHDSTGWYRTSGLQVKPGSACTLSCRYPDGKTVFGTTRVPDSLFITSVAADTVPYVNPYSPETLPALRTIWNWTKARGARDHDRFATARYAAGPDTYDWRADSYNGPPDTALFPLQILWFDTINMLPETLPLISVRLEIRALDPNYFDYSRYWGFSRQREYMHLDGGLGLFGSIAIAETTLLLKP